MSTAAPAASPAVDVPLSEAVECLTGDEVLEIERHFKHGLEHLTGTQTLVGVIYAYEKRRDARAATWPAVSGMTFKQMNGYFAPEPADPDSDEGKDSSTGA